MKQVIKFLYPVLTIIFIASGIFALLLAILPFELIKQIGNLLSPDKNFQSLTFSLVQGIRLPSLVTGIILLLIAFGMLVWKGKTKKILESSILIIAKQWSLFIKDGRSFFHDLWAARPNRKETIALILISLLAAVLRILLINRPVEYDEAYTFTEFARYSVHQILMSYNVPNNHIFHTILVHYSYLFFGDKLWQLRLPTFIASLFLVISVYFLGRNFHNWKTGIVASIFVAVIPSLTVRSVSARGYIIVTFLTVLALWIAGYLARQKNRFGWFLLASFCALGFFTIPMMIFPCGYIFFWLLIIGVSRQYGTEYRNFSNWIKYLLAAGILVIFFTGLLYSFILFNGHIGQIYASNRVLQPMALNSFTKAAPGVFLDAVNEWITGLHPILFYLLIAGLLLSIIFNRSITIYKIPTLLIMVAYLLIILLLMRPYPISRIWIWLLPLLILLSVSGLVDLFERINIIMKKKFAANAILGILTFAMIINGTFVTYSESTNPSYGEDPAAQHVATYLQSHLSENDLVVVSDCSDARYNYYFFVMGIPEQILRNRNRPFDNVYAIVYTQVNPSCGNETLDQVLQHYGPDSVFLNMERVSVVFQYQYATVYQIGTYPDRIKKAFPGSEPSP